MRGGIVVIIVDDGGAEVVDPQNNPEGKSRVQGEDEPQAGNLPRGAFSGEEGDVVDGFASADLASSAPSALAYRPDTALRMLSAALAASLSSRTATSTRRSLHSPPSIFWKLWIGRASTSSWHMTKVGTGSLVAASWVGTEESTSCQES